jgi:quercetin dioxygenase-like cupin family protein
VNRRQMMSGAVALGMSSITQAQSSESATDKASGDFAGGSRVFSLSKAERTKSPNGSERLSAFSGTLATGETASMHESWLPAGTPPPALHRITHSEMIAVLEGELEFVHDDKAERAVAGDVIYVSYGTTHFARNVGTGTARYMVFQIGK